MRLIDVMHLGHERVIGCWQVDDVLVDPGPTSSMPTLLDALAGQRPRALLLTHIHLDHAGASGSLVERWPDLEVYVHEQGAGHLADPSRLLVSARRLYGEDMDRLWGEMVPVPERNLRVLSGGETVRDSFEVAYTPGHAWHHVSYLHGGTAFVGDVGGVRITPSSVTIPPTPPPDIDLQAWHESLQRIAAWRPERLAMTHFGYGGEVGAQLDELGRRLEAWAQRAKTVEQDEFIAVMEAEIEAATEPEWATAYNLAAPPDQMYAGLARYWQKRARSLPPASVPPVS